MYAGHHPDGSGIQAHSAGTHYPLVVSAIATDPAAGKPYHKVEVTAPDGAIVWARITPEWSSRDARIESWDLAFLAAERLAGLY